MKRRTTGQSGLTAVETLLTLLIIGMVVAMAVPPLHQARRSWELRCAASRVGSLLVQCRAVAILHRTATALVFEQHGPRWRCFIAEDGDGDGVHRDDINAERDCIVGEIFEMDSGLAGPGLLEGLPDPAGGGDLGGDMSDPIRAGRGDIVTFTPKGTATPCSIYFTDHRSEMRVLRVLGMTGRVRAMRWQSGWPDWRPSGV